MCRSPTSNSQCSTLIGCLAQLSLPEDTTYVVPTGLLASNNEVFCRNHGVTMTNTRGFGANLNEAFALADNNLSLRSRARTVE